MSAKSSARQVNFEELVYRGVESDELDYKHHMSWHTMSRAAKGKIVRHLMAFANTKGGFLVIGVGEDSFGNPVQRTGVSLEESGSFDPTSVGNFVNSHVEPPIDFTIERPLVRGKRYVILVVRPFRTLPHVCCNSIEGEIQSGVFYIRTVEASSRPARRVQEMQELIRRAMRNERAELGRMLRGILYENQSIVPERERSLLTDMAEESENYFARRMRAPAVPVLRLIAEPGDGSSCGNFSLPLLKKFFKSSWQLLPDAEFLRDGENVFHTTPTSLRHLDLQQRRMWQLFTNGLFCFFYMPPAPERYEVDKLVQLCAESVGFFARLFAEFGWSEELVTLRLSIVNAGNFVLWDSGSDTLHTTENATAEVEMCRSAADLASGTEQHARRLIRRMGELFHLSDFRIEEFSRPVKNILERRW